MHAVPPRPLLSTRVLVLLPPNLTNLGGMLACDGLVRMLVPTGDAELRTSATSMTGHGISANATVTVAANYQTASTAMVLTANLATANEPFVLDYMDVDAG